MRASGSRSVSEDIDSAALTFAMEHVYVGEDEEIPAAEEGDKQRLERVIKSLHESEINAGLQSFCFCGFRAWIGDELNGITASGAVEEDDPGWHSFSAVALWLHQTAPRLYPRKQVCQRGRGLMKRPSKLAPDRVRRFVQALSIESRDGPSRWVSIPTVAERLGMRGEEAIELADQCAREGLVTHDQSQHPAAGRDGRAVRPHSVTLREPDRQMARGSSDEE